jgi:hypothetical protein
MREQYIEMRKAIFELNQKGEQAGVNLGWFYSYYVEEFKNQPKERQFLKKDMFGQVYFDDNDKPIFYTQETHMLSFPEFQHQFGTFFMGYAEDIMTHLDKVYNVSWLCDKDGKYIKFIG